MQVNQEERHTRGTIISVVFGLLACVLGGMLMAAVSSAPPDDQSVLSGLGIFLLVVGAGMFSIAVLVELFSIGTSVRSIAKSNREVLSLLRATSSPNEISQAVGTAPGAGTGAAA
jgi:hypothetical protein